MSRRIALALSFCLTIVVTFALVSFASQAGWLEAKSSDKDPTAVAAETAPSPTAEPTVQPEPRVITEYVYVDVPVGSPPAAPQATAPPATLTPLPTATAPQSGNSNTGSAVDQSAQPVLPASNSTQQPTTRESSRDSDDSEDHEAEHEDEPEHEDHEDDD